MTAWLTTLIVAFAAPTTTPASRSTLAAPRIIMFYGGALGSERRVVAATKDVWEFLGTVTVPGDSLALTGPYVEVALYWNDPIWEPYTTDSNKLASLPLPRLPWRMPAPSSTDPLAFIQPARLYLGTPTTPPVFDWFSAGADPGPRVITPAGLQLLRRYKVPLHQEERLGVGRRLTSGWTLAGARQAERPATAAAVATDKEDLSLCGGHRVARRSTASR
jgi:hypothetical protein